MNDTQPAPPHPPIDQALGEIRAILAKYGLAGSIVLSDEESTATHLCLSPKWACIRQHGGKIRIVSRAEDYPNVAAQKQAIPDTMGMLVALSHELLGARHIVQDVIHGMGEAFGIPVTPEGKQANGSSIIIP